MNEDTLSPAFTAFFRFLFEDGTHVFLLGLYDENYYLPDPGYAMLLDGKTRVTVVGVHLHHDTDVPFYSITIRKTDEEES